MKRTQFRSAWFAGTLVSLVLMVINATSNAKNGDFNRSITGLYSGSFSNSSGSTSYMYTRFMEQSGQLLGEYAAGGFQGTNQSDLGTLTLESVNGNVYIFEWKDRWGVGAVVMTFDEGFTQFDGFWTLNGKREGTWVGTRE
jgi:hypothetical protein